MPHIGDFPYRIAGDETSIVVAFPTIGCTIRCPAELEPELRNLLSGLARPDTRIWGVWTDSGRTGPDTGPGSYHAAPLNLRHALRELVYRSGAPAGSVPELVYSDTLEVHRPDGSIVWLEA